MDHHWQTMMGRQFAAAIQMMRLAIEACPDDLWDDRTDGSPFWHLAYHALYFTDLYLSDDLESFQARDFHEDHAHFLPGDYKEFGGIVTTPEKAYTQDQLLEYADHCLQKCDETFDKLTDQRSLERCGFWWYELNAGEFLLNNLRHAQHHAGQLSLLLRNRAGIGIDWLGTKDNKPPHEEDMTNESESASLQPKPLDDDWSIFLIGKWQVTEGGTEFLGDDLDELEESNTEVKAGFLIEPVLNGQFLMMKPWLEMDEIPDEQTQELSEEQFQHLKESANVSDEEIERFMSMPYTSLQILTVDPTTGERISYVFDSLRSIAKGTGHLEGNKEVMEWEWSGNSPGVTSESVMGKIDDKTLSISHKYRMPDGKEMEEKLDMIRV